jgi:ATP-dependent exoDNAse (exonuclease V) beta subunit
MKMIERRPSDFEARAQALRPDKSFIIQAPAGSGKTELLTDRILALLGGVTKPEEILAITFTRKAAAEMHARVLRKLRAGLSEQEPASAHEKNSWRLARAALARNEQQGWDLLNHPARLKVRTIDAFCAQLVRSMPWMSAMGGMPGIADNPEQLYLQAARRLLEHVDHNESVQDVLLHMDIDLGSIERLIVDMLARRDQWLQETVDTQAAMTQLRVALRDVMEQKLDALAEAMPFSYASELAPIARLAAASQAETAVCMLDALMDWDGEPLASSVETLPQWHALSRLLLTGSGGLRKRLTVKEGFPAKSAHKQAMQDWLDAWQSDSEHWAGLLAEISALPLEVLSERQEKIIRSLLETLKLAAAELTLVFREEKQVDFIEIAQRAALALGYTDDPTDMLLKLDARISHILIDEFQDTSQIQIQLIEKLSLGWSPGDGRTLFLVGDPMQSIYRFRKADVGLFLSVAHEGINGLELEKLVLTENFRSQAGVVNWVNQSFSRVFPEYDDLTLGAIRYTDSVAFNPAAEGPAVRLHPVYQLEGKDTQEVQAQAEQLTLELVRAALAANPDSDHPVAILVKARTHLGALMLLMQRHGIPVRAVELNPIRAEQSVTDLVQLIRALAHPADRVAWLSVLRSPVCGLTLKALTHLFGDSRDTIAFRLQTVLAREAEFAPLLGDEWPRLQRCARILLDRSHLTADIAFSSHVESVWRALGGYGVYASDTAFADFQAVFDLVDRLAPYGDLNPADLEDALARLYSATSAQQRAVEIMTMHKSKGLEFEEVILYGLHRRPRADTAPLLRFERNRNRLLMGPIKPKAAEETDKLSAMLGAMEKRRSDYELDRLLYVAATRARQRLHLVSQVQCKQGQVVDPPRGSLLSRLFSLFEFTPPEPQAQQEAATADAATPGVQGPVLSRIATAALGQLPVVSDRSAITGSAGSGWQFDDKYEASIGTVAHAWLARIGQDRMRGWDEARLHAAQEVIVRQLENEGLRQSQARSGAQRVYELLSRCVASEKGRWLLSHDQARQELSLTSADGKLLIVDVAVSTETGWLVVDFKTGVRREHEPQDVFEARMRDTYRLQLQGYCERLSQMDGRDATAAIFALDTGDWIEFDPVLLTQAR